MCQYRPDIRIGRQCLRWLRFVDSRTLLVLQERSRCRRDIPFIVEGFVFARNEHASEFACIGHRELRQKLVEAGKDVGCELRILSENLRDGMDGCTEIRTQLRCSGGKFLGCERLITADRRESHCLTCSAVACAAPDQSRKFFTFRLEYCGIHSLHVGCCSSHGTPRLQRRLRVVMAALRKKCECHDRGGLRDSSSGRRLRSPPRKGECITGGVRTPHDGIVQRRGVRATSCFPSCSFLSTVAAKSVADFVLSRYALPRWRNGRRASFRS